MSANAIGLRAYKLPRNKTTHVQPHAYMNICTTTGADGLAASKKGNGAGRGQAKPTLKRPAAAVSGKPSNPNPDCLQTWCALEQDDAPISY